MSEAAIRRFKDGLLEPAMVTADRARASRSSSLAVGAGDFAALRQTLGYTQAQLGELFGISGPHLSRIERGVTRPSRPVEKLFHRLVASPEIRRRIDEHLQDVADLFTNPCQCRRCGIKTGPGLLEAGLVEGLCSKCHEESRRLSAPLPGGSEC